MPIHWNPLPNEPYLRLPAPHTNIILTPGRLSQADQTCTALVQILNDPLVYPWLEGPPYPYLHSHGVEWVEKECAANAETLSDLRREHQGSNTSSRAESQPQTRYHDIFPFSNIREVVSRDADGNPLQDVLIGDVSLRRYSFYEYPYGSAERAEAQRVNNELPAGDGRIVWGLGSRFQVFVYCSWPIDCGLDFLAPSYHGRGIMTCVVRTALQDWGVPRMNIRILKASALVGNAGSLKVLEKNNFETECVLENWVPVSESREGGRKSCVVLKWRGK